MRISKGKLEVVLARKCWNQRKLRKIGVVSSQTIARINANMDIRPETAGKIASALGVDVTEIMEDVGIDNSKGF